MNTIREYRCPKCNRLILTSKELYEGIYANVICIDCGWYGPVKQLARK